MALVAGPQPMALLIAVLLAFAAALFPEGKAEHHRQHRGGYRAPPPPPPSPFIVPPNPFPTSDVCDLCDRPIVPPPMPMVPPGDFSVVPGFPGLSVSAAAGSSAAAAAASMSTTSAAVECVAPLAQLSTACGAFLTRSDPETPAPQSSCCADLVAFVNSSRSSSADDDGGHGTLRCMSPLILRHVNKLLDVPLDAARMMYLPIQCGVVFPPETLYVCLTGQQTPPLVSRIPDAWEKPAAVPLPGV